ncbi:GNAT family N-acetyltransferase [Deinococcus cellulosilyticus]|uniref:GNAT family N-acetyltransferase n=1 Tax=Deinococcus cellulosilyticus (strain DSM 18568 / NBRC 106333 / KACC 11606 / 5516J-15) TaxID=1223518 RepID=A0A511MZH3_DEIC1|nr:GNAT family N-acetyltransferase [Deinococcus cellulosilyticus]GEM45994.1 GNAT family N-acetyltransferase [Deinococcus cellulosilyticus NBRC 106333 = KACC 11606]
MQIRKALPEDAKHIVELQQQHYLNQWTFDASGLAQNIEKYPERGRLVAEQDGKVVGYASYAPAEVPATLHVRFYAHADHPEARESLYAAVLQKAQQYQALESTIREDYIAARAFLEQQGFQNTFQSYGATVDLQSFDFQPFEGLEERLFIEGFEVHQGTPEPSAELFELYLEGFEGVPQVPATRWSVQTREDFEKTYWQEGFVWFTAAYRNQVVALTVLDVRQPDIQSEITLTGRKFRHRGLCTLVKAHALQWARTQGHLKAGTGGAVINLPMLKVNRRLGYHIEPMWLTYTRKL